MALAEKYHGVLRNIPFAGGELVRPLTEVDSAEPIREALARPDTKVMLLGPQGIAAQNHSLLYMPVEQAREAAPKSLVHLGAMDGVNYVLLLADAGAVLQDTEWISLREAFGRLEARDLGLFVVAQAIGNWRLGTTFCPQCGSSLEPTNLGWSQRCADGQHELFPRTDPAVIASIIDAEDRLLLGANVRFKKKIYSVLAGFVEAGESLEAAVRREIFEESGVRVGECAYRGSQPWPLPRSLMLGFSGEALSTELIPDGQEILDLRWFTREELHDAITQGLLDVPRGPSIAGALIEDWYGHELPKAVA
ncbi:NAD(+) diphosphatase [Glutamicibacter sp. X7]